MKTLVIFVLFAALLLAACLTNPGQADFKRYLESTATNPFEKVFVNWEADHYTYSNKLLWTDVQKQGKTIYTGAFGHFHKRKL